jgi:hypothetical protein
MEGILPKFVDVPEQRTVFSYAYDFHLRADSPGKNAGTDGTDIGIYGGPFPWPDGGSAPWQTSPVPAVPQITSLDTLNVVVPVNGTLSVDVKASKKD